MTTAERRQCHRNQRVAPYPPTHARPAQPSPPIPPWRSRPGSMQPPVQQNVVGLVIPNNDNPLRNDIHRPEHEDAVRSVFRVTNASEEPHPLRAPSDSGHIISEAPSTHYWVDYTTGLFRIDHRHGRISRRSRRAWDWYDRETQAALQEEEQARQRASRRLASSEPRDASGHGSPRRVLFAWVKRSCR